MNKATTALDRAIFWFETDSKPGPHLFSKDELQSFVWYWLLQAALLDEI